MKSKQNVNLDSYFEFLEQYFALFPNAMTKVKRKIISGDNFKL